VARCWIFASKSKENIRRAYERLIWGFWDRDVARRSSSKLVRNWRSFLRLYNNISNGDIVFFQITETGDIHAVGIVKEKFYDDQTPIWDQEIKKKRVLFPWRISFYIIIYSEEPIAKLFTKIENYVDGYGIGELPHHEAQQIIKQLKEKLQNLSIDFQTYL